MGTISKIKNAGSIFVEPYASVAAGDYVSRANHVLYTTGNVKPFSRLNIVHLRKTSTVQILSNEGLDKLAQPSEKSLKVRN